MVIGPWYGYHDRTMRFGCIAVFITVKAESVVTPKNHNSIIVLPWYFGILEETCSQWINEDFYSTASVSFTVFIVCVAWWQFQKFVHVVFLQEFLLYMTLESGNMSVLHVYEKNSGKEVDAGRLRHKSRGRPYDVIAYADSQQPLYNSHHYHNYLRHHQRCYQLHMLLSIAWPRPLILH